MRPEQILTLGASQSMGLQVADAIASSAFQALNKSDYGYVEDKYMRILCPTLYRYKKTIWGYGLKVFPENEQNNPTSKLFEWVHDNI